MAHLNRYTPKISGDPKSWPVVNSLAPSTLQSKNIPKVVQTFGSFQVVFWGDEFQFPGQLFDFSRKHVIHIPKGYGATINVSYPGTFLVHAWMSQIFANALRLKCKLQLALCRSVFRAGGSISRILALPRINNLFDIWKRYWKYEIIVLTCCWYEKEESRVLYFQVGWKI